MARCPTALALAATIALHQALGLAAGSAGPFQRRWVYASETSAVVYWQLADIRREAPSLGTLPPHHRPEARHDLSLPNGRR